MPKTTGPPISPKTVRSGSWMPWACVRLWAPGLGGGLAVLALLCQNGQGRPGPRAQWGVVQALDGGSRAVLNVAATGVSAPTFLTVWPAGTDRPLAANLNPGPGDVVSNLVVAAVGAGGVVSVYNEAGTIDVVVKSNGQSVTIRTQKIGRAHV